MRQWRAQADRCSVPCSRKWDDVSRLLSDIGLVLEYADLLSGHVEPAGACAQQEAQLCLKHVAHLARKHLPFICGKGWSALATKVRPHNLLTSMSPARLSNLHRVTAEALHDIPCYS